MGAGIDHITAGNQLIEHRKMAEPVEFGEILEVEADLNELEELLSHAKRPKTPPLTQRLRQRHRLQQLQLHPPGPCFSRMGLLLSLTICSTCPSTSSRGIRESTTRDGS